MAASRFNFILRTSLPVKLDKDGNESGKQAPPRIHFIRPLCSIVFKKDNITVITNNLAAINILIQNPAIKIVSIGGIIDSQEKSTYGTTCEQEFGQYFPDIAFLSINAINYKDGFTDFRISEIGIIKLLSQRSEKVIAIMDSSKIGKRSKQKVLNLDNVDLLLTDDNISPILKEKYKNKGLLIE